MTIVFATSNMNKINEVQVLLPESIKILSLKDIGCFEDIPETQNTIEGNAIQKAKYVKDKYGYDCFADDTGLEVNALNGKPGVFSARYAGEQRSAADNNTKLLKELQLKSNRNAQFKTVIALHLNNNLHIFTGICEGSIAEIATGDNGFGYDPIFKPFGFEKSFSEMSLKLKNRISHRGKAISELIKFLNS